ncbi:11S globulin seed storage protein Ana o 2.0101-like [Mercurialis annua]|uniref:11S globulin seed storage protein Ana o 2.0101-like n=1 Tax=Mercurialis annua TaxID=3986 RepID=UPI00215E05F1|nr:11S globulin seed storage protein Ana o 2.0101-like [Mercurialis annua]
MQIKLTFFYKYQSPPSPFSSHHQHKTHTIMAKPCAVLLSVTVFLLVLLHGSVARREFMQQGNECQLSRLHALEPDNRVECEAGLVESWNPNRDQFQCAGVAVVRRTIQPNGLLLPSYSNAPQLLYIVKGRGMTGMLFPGCAETFQESQESAGGSSSKFQDQHQKVRHFRQGDIIALPAGVAHWCYNDGNEPVVMVSVLDTANNHNQLDINPRNFYLAGNPEDEFEQFKRGTEREQRPLRRIRERQQGSCNNLFCGMDSRVLSEAFDIDEQLARKLQSRNDYRGSIVHVEGGLQVVRPPRTIQERQEQEERMRERRTGPHYNGIEETFCTMRIKENIADPSRADVFVPEVGRVSTVNSHNLPILRSLQLSASHVVLRNDAVRLPHWNLNAHSLIYAVRGQARIQVVDENGNSVFDGSVREGQVLTVPQNFVVVKRAESERFEYVAFKTNDNAMTSDLSGRTSALRGMPVEVLANAFRVSIEEASRIKFSRKETTLGSSSRFQSGRRLDA